VGQVFAGGADLATPLEQVARIGAWPLLQAALEAEVSEFPGREPPGTRRGQPRGR
jgi:hypothetical protein